MSVILLLEVFRCLQSSISTLSHIVIRVNYLKIKPKIFCNFQLLVSTIDFRYITDVVTPAEAVEFLKQNAAGKEKREKELREVGYPCYTTQVGKSVKYFKVNGIIKKNYFKRLDRIHR